MMPSAVIESKADFNSGGAELFAATGFVFTLVGVVVHESAKLSTAANETIAWIRFLIFEFLDSVVGFGRDLFLCRNVGTSQTPLDPRSIHSGLPKALGRRIEWWQRLWREPNFVSAKLCVPLPLCGNKNRKTYKTAEPQKNAEFRSESLKTRTAAGTVRSV
jgi:hypothetical protein